VSWNTFAVVLNGSDLDSTKKWVLNNTPIIFVQFQNLFAIIALSCTSSRYIEIFRSSLSEVRAAIGPKMRPMGPGSFNQRPAPYDRGDRFGGMNRYNNMGRGSRSFKGEFVV
jgi:hypothetical protein